MASRLFTSELFTITLCASGLFAMNGLIECVREVSGDPESAKIQKGNKKTAQQRFCDFAIEIARTLKLTRAPRWQDW